VAHFQQYGSVENVNIVMNNHDGKPSGFGFVTLRTPGGDRKVLKDEHWIHNSKVPSFLV